MIIGPIYGVEEEEERYKLILTRDGYSIVIPKTWVKSISDCGGGVCVDLKEGEGNPWVRVAQYVAGKNAIGPTVSGNTVYNVVPVHTLEINEVEGGSIVKFLGYHIRFENGNPSEILSLGVYERFVPRGLEGKEFALPAIPVKGEVGLTQEEKAMLASATPIELLPLLDKAGKRDIVANAIASLVRSNPLALANLDKNLFSKYVVDETDQIVAQALMETHPAIIESLIEQLRAKGFDNVKLNLLYVRLAEEKQEEEQLQRMKEEEERRKRIQEQVAYMEKMRREASKILDEFKALLKEIAGITLPLTIISAGAGMVISETTKATRKLEETLVEEEEVKI